MIAQRRCPVDKKGLIDTLDCALELAKQRCREMRCGEDLAEFGRVQSLLSDPDALMWRLLEERAGEGTSYEEIPYLQWGLRVEEMPVYKAGFNVRLPKVPFRYEGALSPGCFPSVSNGHLILGDKRQTQDLILILARAIQEQEERGGVR